GPVCSIILITGAGGAFGAILTATGIGGELADSLDSLGLPLIVAAYLVTMAMRVAQGSATVAATTGASIMAPAMMAGDFSSVAVAAVVVAIGAASIGWSHVNDSGFWLIGRFCGFDTVTTFKTWSLVGTTISIVGFALSWVVFLIARSPPTAGHFDQPEHSGRLRPTPILRALAIHDERPGSEPAVPVRTSVPASPRPPSAAVESAPAPRPHGSTRPWPQTAACSSWTMTPPARSAWPASTSPSTTIPPCPSAS